MNAQDSRSPFDGFFLGGFECSSHRRADGRRLDLLAATGHDRHAESDYQALVRHGIRTVRDGVRWHRIETVPHRYDWSSALPMLEAADRAGVQVVWDLCHYGWPDDLDIWSDAFPIRFATFAAAMAELVRRNSDAVPLYCPVNEISFWAWAGGEVGRFNPSSVGRGGALKRQLVRAAIAAIRAIRAIDSRARFITAEPLIEVTSGSADEAERYQAEAHRLSQFEALDLLTGRIEPELGGSPDMLDIAGWNFYPDNQWYAGGSTIPLGHHAYRPLSEMLAEAHARYGRPLLIAETGAEGSGRASWLHYVGAESRRALRSGVPLTGICLYPVVDYPGWENDRACRVGLLSDVDAEGKRLVFSPLAEELAEQQSKFRDLMTGSRPVDHALPRTGTS